MKSILITGTSSGIGLECARIFTKRGYHVFGSVRNAHDAEKVTNLINRENFTPLIFDVTHAQEIALSLEIVKDILNANDLGGIINNAGIAVAGPLLHIAEKDFKEQLAVNVLGVVSVIKTFLPLLNQKSSAGTASSKILNISSVSGKIAYPFLGPYAASKHALEALSNSLRNELAIYNIKVITIALASVDTPIWGKNDLDKYSETDWSIPLNRLKQEINKQKNSYLSAAYCAQKIYEIFVSKRKRQRYTFARNIMLSWYLPRLLPQRILDHFIQKSLHLKQAKNETL